MSVLGRAPLAYRRRASALHAASGPVAAAYSSALAAAALLSENPLVLGALLLAVLGAGAGAGVLSQLGRSTRRSLLTIVLPIVLVNLLVSREGLTVFARLGELGPLGEVDLTVQALVYGLVFGLRLLVVALACSLLICTADPDGLLRSFRRLSPRSALAAALATRLIPVIGADASRLSEAQRSRPDAGAHGAAEKLALVRATVGGALDRALDVAAVLEMRGYGASRRTLARSSAGGLRHGARPWRARSRHDLAFAAAAAAVLALSLLTLIGGAARFHAYPLIGVSAGARVFALCGLLLAVALAPFADRRGIEP